MEITTFKIEGMTCDHCATSIAKKFNDRQGVTQNKISYPEGSGKFVYDPEIISKEEIIEIINRTGHYKVVGEVAAEREAAKQYDLIIIGGGSAAFSAAIKAEGLGLNTLMVNGGLDFGGTCVNVGCVPSKNLIRAGEAAHRASHSNFEGIKPKGFEIDFATVIKSKKRLVANLQQKKYLDVVSDFQGLTMKQGWAEFVDKNTIVVNGSEQYRGIKILIATGSTTHIPAIKGLSSSGYLTNISLFNLEEQPKSLIVLGGGYVALELAQAYHRLGTRVTLLQRSNHILSNQSADVSDEIARHLVSEGAEIQTGLRFVEVLNQAGQVHVVAGQDGVVKTFSAEKIVVATGTKPNTSRLALENIGLQLTASGHVAVNDKMETNLPNVFAAGDVANTPAYVYTAAHEGKIAVETAFSSTGKTIDYSALPWVVFTDPQVAGVGLDELSAALQNIPFEVSKIELKEIPRAIAAHDTRGFIKLIRNTDSDKLIGARIVAPGGGELIQLLSMAIKHGITIAELVENLYPYLTLSEGIKLAAITFGKDVSKLSCCAS